ncbi:MAG TPA: alpha/beta fold hydrolase [Solirubrobacteraceae bacterium]|jgi:pimeloyl-ACP methyl ester carboxylesterase
MTDLAPHPDGKETHVLHGRPGYITTDATPLFAVLHLPAGECSSVGVVICSPFGWDELGAHRSLRALAGALASAGHPALRFDLPGTGDSGGSPRDPERLDAWTTSVESAATMLRNASGCERVVAVGIGLGGVIAVRAVALGAAIDDLVLWSVPARGSLLVREMRTFARMADAELVDTGLAREEPPPPHEDPLSEGDLNVAGFVLTAATIADLEALDLTELEIPAASDRRVLLLGRDSLPPDRRLRARFEELGMELSVGAGPGYDTMMVDPHLSELPSETIADVLAWVEKGDESPSAAGSGDGGDGLAESIDLVSGDSIIRETPFGFEFEGERLVGVLTEPVSAEASDLCALLLNSGAVRHIGPQRIWVEAARRWGSLGVSTLRFDVAGVGGSDGDSAAYSDRGAFQRPEFAVQVITAIDELERRGGPGRFLVGGVCSGAYWGLHSALADERIHGVLMINLLAFNWTEELGALRDTRRARALLQEREVATVLRIIATDRWRISRMLLTKLRGLRLRRGDSGAQPLVNEVTTVLDGMRDRDVQMTLALSLNEPLWEDFVADGLMERLAEWPNLHLERIPTMEHVFRSPLSQRYAHATLDGALARTLASSVEPPSDS